jgi:hypothetical protein
MKTNFYLFFICCFLLGCTKNTLTSVAQCPQNVDLSPLAKRNFKMGFSTWSFGGELADVESTYRFIHANSDIYSEQIDDKIPWSAWINKMPLPKEFVENINFRLSKRSQAHQLLLSVSLLNTNRDDLAPDVNELSPSYNTMNDLVIENAYIDHLTYLINRFQPNFLVFAMEVNELRLKSIRKWDEYKLLAGKVRQRIKQLYPTLPIAESVTLHNWFNANISNAAAYTQEIATHANQSDFLAVSFYPFLKGLSTPTGFQQAFDFLHTTTQKPIAFVETSHHAKKIEIAAFNFFLNGNVCEQKEYLETLCLNAHSENYWFVIWWAHRDYEKLLAIFPPEMQDLGKIWVNTGLLDKDGKERPIYEVWKQVFKK